MFHSTFQNVETFTDPNDSNVWNWNNAYCVTEKYDSQFNIARNKIRLIIYKAMLQQERSRRSAYYAMHSVSVRP